MSGFQPPSIGRKLWYWRGADCQSQPYDSTVVYVHSDRCVNLSMRDSNGDQFPLQHVLLRQPGDAVPQGPYCEWMPYQQQQHAWQADNSYEKLEHRLRELEAAVQSLVNLKLQEESAKVASSTNPITVSGLASYKGPSST